MLEAVVSLKIPDCWVTQIAQKYGVDVQVVDRKVLGNSGMKDLFEISAREDDFDRIMQDIRRHKNVSQVEVITTERGKMLGISYSDNCTACRTLTGSNCFLTTAISRQKAAFEWTLVFSNRASLQRLVKRLQRLGYEVDLLRISAVKTQGKLTPRQEEVLTAAVDMGYYEFPKRVGVGEVAAKFKISKSTASEILRRGEEKILRGYFDKIAA